MSVTDDNVVVNGGDNDAIMNERDHAEEITEENHPELSDSIEEFVKIKNAQKEFRKINKEVFQQNTEYNRMLKNIKAKILDEMSGMDKKLIVYKGTEIEIKDRPKSKKGLDNIRQDVEAHAEGENNATIIRSFLDSYEESTSASANGDTYIVSRKHKRARTDN